MESNPRYSIIIPVYNAERFLDDCLSSLLSQSVECFEIILIDDGSTDGSGMICDEYANRSDKIKVFHQNNSGASAARNLGIDHARGEWISFVDADDWVSPDYLLTIDESEPKADINFFSVVCEYADGCQVTRFLKPFYTDNKEDIEAQVYKMRYGSVGDFFGYTHCKFVKASLVQQCKIRFDNRIVFREDEIFTLHLLKYARSIQMFGSPLYYYRYLNEGLTAKGVQRGDRLLLANHLQDNLQNFSHQAMIEADIRRIVDYYIDDALFSVSLIHLFLPVKGLRKFFNDHPFYAITNIHPFLVRHFRGLYVKEFLVFYFYYVYKWLRGYFR